MAGSHQGHAICQRGLVWYTAALHLFCWYISVELVHFVGVGTLALSWYSGTVFAGAPVGSDLKGNRRKQQS